MKVKMKTTIAGPKFSASAVKTIIVSDEQGQNLVDEGYAVKVGDGGGVQTADSPAPENAAMNYGGGGGGYSPTDGIKASNPATALAVNAGVDLGSIKGTGKDGQITKPDVQAAINAAGDGEGNG